MSENINVVPLRQPNEVDDPLTNRVTELLAERIIALAETGERGSRTPM